MGNSICGKASIEKEITERESLTIKILKNPKIIKNNLFSDHNTNSLILKNNDLNNKNSVSKHSFDQNNLSFIKNDKDDKNETFSFIVYGNEVSKVRHTFLAELNNMKDLTLKISKNQLLLFTEDNQDLLNLLKAKKINPNNLFGDENYMNNTVLENNDEKIIPFNENGLKEIPDFIKNKYNRMIEKSLLNLNNDSSKFLNSFILEEEDFKVNIEYFLDKQNILNREGVKIELWKSEKHELEYSNTINENLNELKNKIVEDKLVKLSYLTNMKCDNDYQNTKKNPIFENFDLKKIKKKDFSPEIVHSAILGLMQYDIIFKTRLLTRIIYPQKSGIPYPSKKGLYSVKININGGKRAIILQDFDNEKENKERINFILNKAIDIIYKGKGNVSNIVYRLSGWIPENLNIFDIGDALASFSKLEENFNKGFLILFYKDSVENVFKPILNFKIDKQSYKRFIKTTSFDDNDNFIFLDWEDLYNKKKIEYLSINWNPTIYNFRKKLHFEVPVKFKIEENSFFNKNYKFCRYTQILLTIFPHTEQSESRLIIEKHKNLQNIDYTIKYYLYHFYNNRMASKEPALKELFIKETENELLTDIIVFEENSSYENYVLIIELIPENNEDLKKLNFETKEVISLSMFSFAEFNILEIPFKKIDIYEKKQYNYQNINIENIKKYPLYKISCNSFGYYEIRVEGIDSLYYGIYIYKYQNYKICLKKKDFFKGSPFKNKEVCTISFKLDKGDYVVQIIPGINDGTEEENDINFNNQEKIINHKMNIEFISYSNELVKKFEQHLYKKNCYLENKKFNISEISLNNNLIIKKEFQIEWNINNNFGTAKAKTQCFQKFMKNPGFIIYLDEETDIKCLLSCKKKDMKEDDIPVLGINILKIKKNYKFENILEDNFKKCLDYETDEITLQKSELGYLIICFNVDKNFIGKTNLTILSNKNLKKIKDNKNGLENFKNEMKLSSKLKKGSGGHFNKPSFLFNPSFILKISNSQKIENKKIFSELFIQSKVKPCSLYLYNTDKTSIFDLTNKELNNAFYNPAFLYEFNSLNKKLTNGNYLIIPSTLNELENDLNFDLKIKSDLSFEFFESPFFNIKQNSKIEISDCNQYNLKFQLLKKCDIIFYLLPKQENLDIKFIFKNTNTNLNVFEENFLFTDNFWYKKISLQKIGNKFTLIVRSNKTSSYHFGIISNIDECIKFI